MSDESRTDPSLPAHHSSLITHHLSFAMSPQFWLNVFVRWIHISAAVVGVGALAFVRLALIPAMAGEPESAAWARLMRRFKLILHTTIGLLLLSGIYNLIVVIPRANALGDLKPFYHAV